MARQIIDTTTNNGSYTGDPAKVAFNKTNDNFQELYGLVGPLAQLAGGNYLINPEMRINQRNFGGGSLAANVYGYDRWKGGSGGCSITVNQSTGVITHTSGTYQQIIETPNLAGKTVTLSVENPSGSVNLNVGGVSGTINAGSGRRGQQFALPAGATGNITVSVQATGVTYSRLKLEVGTSATPFESRPMAQELALCQRYYETSFAAGVTPGTGQASPGYITCAWTTGKARSQFIPFKVTKRAVPALTAYTSSDANTPLVGRWSLWNGTIWNTAGVATFNSNKTLGFDVEQDFSAGLTINGSYLISGNWTADAEL